MIVSKNIMRYLTKKNRMMQAFTLMEMLVVTVIIAILSSLVFSVGSSLLVNTRKTACVSNQRQIGAAILNYAGDNNGALPTTTHSTGSRRKEMSWIYVLSDYLANVDEVRICPADPKSRQELIRKLNATSYVLNDYIFDDQAYNIVQFQNPQETMLLFILSEDKPPSITWDHAHCAEWSNFQRASSDIEVDRHRKGKRANDRLKGSANYLFADGHVENIQATDLKTMFESGNPAIDPLTKE